ncbi:MAG: DegT/DnrJ/EryC1/StrS family aminotransferase [Bacteroidota bacterium]|nr:DegT/DnrJ/EryC1/StrS family aminotransferase [Bacteroidota bacterium]
MMKLQMVDLGGQLTKIEKEVDLVIKEVLNSTAFINGSKVHEFQQQLEKYLDVKHVIPCANGTDALQVALMALDLNKGDEIICPDFTFVATAEVVKLLGLKAIFVDVDKENFNIDIAKIESVITSRTKAIIPVHLFGQCANMEAILKIANKNDLYVIEDTAQAIGAEYIFENGNKQKAGTIGTIGTTSFFPSKNLGCFGDGGAIFTNDDKLEEKMRKIVNHGMEDRYHYKYIGVNSRLDSLQAAVLGIKLKHLESYNASRVEAAKYYNECFKNEKKITTPKENDYSSHVFHQYTLKLQDVNRKKLCAYLQEKGIPFGVYYPIPLHQQAPYYDKRFSNEDFSNTNALCKSVISLPMHTELIKEQIDFISNTIITFINSE